MKNLTEIKKILATTKEQPTITLAQLQEAKETYKKQAQIDYKAKEYTISKLCLNVLQKAFFNYLETLSEDELQNYYKSIFTQNFGYNAQLSIKNDDDTFNNLLSVKITNDSDVVKLIEDFNFRLM